MESQNVHQQAADLEVWVDVVGYNGVYQVSNKCRVRTTGMRVTHKNGRTTYIKPRLSTIFVNTNGYLAVGLSKNKKQKQCLLHRLVAEAFIPNPDNKPFVNHINGIKTDPSIANLEWTTPKENNLHAFKIGLASLKGEKHTQNKLTNEAVIDIRENCNKRGLPKVYAKKYSVNVTTILDVVNKRTWTHV